MKMQQKNDMRRILSSIFLASATLFLASCSFFQTNEDEKNENDSEANIMREEGLEYTELTKAPLPCSKELLSTAWKQIGVIETSRRKSLDYKQHTPTLFISADLDKDGCPEILLRGEEPYAAIFSYTKQDSLQLITFVNNPHIGLSITPDGVILRNGTDHDGASFSHFIKLKDSKVAMSGEIRETFVIKKNEMISGGVQYILKTSDTATKVSAEEYKQVAPEQNGTFLEDIDGWEDFRKP
jgi:hypothetical protein